MINENCHKKKYHNILSYFGGRCHIYKYRNYFLIDLCPVVIKSMSIHISQHMSRIMILAFLLIVDFDSLIIHQFSTP